MINEFEKKILLEINFAKKILAIWNKYVDDKSNKPLFKKEEVKTMFTLLGLKYKNKGNSYDITINHKNYRFEFHYLIRRNLIDAYIYIYIDEELLRNGFNNMGFALNFLPYDKALAEQINTMRFGLNSFEDLKNYTKDMYDLFDEFVGEYIKEIEAGNAL